MKKIEIGQNARVLIYYKTAQPYVSKEEEKSIIAAMAQKYGIPAKHITLEKKSLNKNGDTLLAGDIIEDRHSPAFQQELMKQYIQTNDIKDIDFNEIIKIDSQINSLIDYDSYGKSKKYVIKWLKWSNFLSYGPDNYFDFTNLHGLVLLNGQPANKSGKSTFAYDLLHFLLFGKTNTKKAKTMGDLFNNYLPDENTLKVEGCLEIDGEDYIIRRTLTRAGGKKKTVSNKVEYFKLLSDGSEELLEDENQQGATTTQTSQIIKESIGNEDDFDLIISANAKDLDDLINLTESEKGRLLSRWIGLSVIEDKDVLARQKWNKEISVGRYCDMYNRVQLQNEIDELNKENEDNKKEIETTKEKVKQCEKNIKEKTKDKEDFLSMKQQIDDKLLKVDVVTLQNSINTIIENGKRKKTELEGVQQEIKKFGSVEYSEEEYKKLKSENDKLIAKMAEARTNIKNLKTTNTNLANAEYCPTCHRKLENVDNTATINANNKTIKELTANGIEMKKKSDEITAKMQEIEKKRNLAQAKSKLELKVAAINVELADGRTSYQEKNNLLAEVQKNKDAIAKNSEIDAKLNVINATIKSETDLKDSLNTSIIDLEKTITKNNETINQKKSYIVKIDEEQKIEKYWKLYLQMIGKDGISKMVLKNTLPIINGELNRLLSNATDFRVEIVMNEKNDVDFLLIRDNVITRLSAASGLETTQAALALRVVLGKMSQLSKPPFILLDEVLGTVAKENYDDMKKLYDKIIQEYDFVLHICHIDLDWYNNGNVITVVKKDNISHLNG